jgi:hypothetical protein
LEKTPTFFEKAPMFFEESPSFSRQPATFEGNLKAYPQGIRGAFGGFLYHWYETERPGAREMPQTSPTT